MGGVMEGTNKCQCGQKGASDVAAGATLHSRVGSERDERLLFLLLLLREKT